MTSTARRRVDNVRLIPYLILLTAVMVGFHLYLNLVTDGVVDLIAAAILAVAAIVVLVGYLRWRRDLQRHAFGILVFHVLSYLIVVGSIAVHAFASTTAGANFRLTGGLVWLVALWSLGLFVHTLAANASRGSTALNPDQEMLKDYILNTWSNNHKKSALAVLTLLVINAHNTWSGDLQRQLEAITGGSMVMDQHNLNRLLRRLEQLELIAARRTPNETGGAHRKTYRITHYGRHVLQEYCTSTLNYLNSPQFQEMIDRAVGSPATVDGRSCCGAEANRPRRNGG